MKKKFKVRTDFGKKDVSRFIDIADIQDARLTLIDPDNLYTRQGYNEVLRSIDPYTSGLTPEEYERLRMITPERRERLLRAIRGIT